MKTFFVLSVSLLAGAVCSAAPVQRIEAFATIHGKAYRDVTIVRVDPDGVSFTHAKGAGRVLFADLPADTRARLGYDATKAEAHEKALAEKRQKEREAAIQRRKDVAQRLAVAVEIQRQAAFEQQFVTALSLLGYNYGYGYSYPVAVPAVGLMNGLYQTYLPGRVMPDGRGVHQQPREPGRGHVSLSGAMLENANLHCLPNRSVHEVRDLRQFRPGGPAMSPMGPRSSLAPQPARFTNGVPALNASFAPARAPVPAAPAPRMGGISVPAPAGPR